MPPETFSIAQVTPYAWEEHHEVNRFVERVSDELCGRGHRVVVITPSDSRRLVRESRAAIKACANDPESIFAEDGCARVLAVGQSVMSRRGGSVSVPIDVSRTIESVLEAAPFDFVHVHEPFAPSASSAALRHSRALNVGTFHAATERVLVDSGRAPVRRALLRPARRADGELPLDARPDPPPLPRRLRGDPAGRRPRGAAHAGRRGDRRHLLRGRGGAQLTACVPARAAAATGAPALARDDLVAAAERPRLGDAAARAARARDVRRSRPTAPRPSTWRARRSRSRRRPGRRPRRSTSFGRSQAAPCRSSRACPSTRMRSTTASAGSCSSRATPRH